MEPLYGNRIEPCFTDRSGRLHQMLEGAAAREPDRCALVCEHLGTIDENGYVRVMDRKKDMINRGGFKIYTIEVENALYEHASVQECAVLAQPCPVLGERVHAFVSLKPDYARTGTLAAELQAHGAVRLSDYKVPESYTRLTQPLPRNANGKLLKREIREQLVQGSASKETPA